MSSTSSWLIYIYHTYIIATQFKSAGEADHEKDENDQKVETKTLLRLMIHLKC